MLLCTSFIYCITCIVADHPKITTKTIKQEHPTKNYEVSVQGGQQMSILQFGNNGERSKTSCKAQLKRFWCGGSRYEPDEEAAVGIPNFAVQLDRFYILNENCQTHAMWIRNLDWPEQNDTRQSFDSKFGNEERCILHFISKVKDLTMHQVWNVIHEWNHKSRLELQ